MSHSEGFVFGHVLEDLKQDVQPQPPIMTEIKEQFEAMSTEGKIEFIGKLTDLAAPDQFHGSVSPAGRLNSAELTTSDIATAKEYVSLCYVPVTEGKGLRCVEDREESTYDDSDPQSYELGPQVQGATIDIAAAKRLARGISDGNTLEEDVDTEIAEHSSRFTPSAHTDELNQDDGAMGCGAQKGQETKLGYYQDEAHMKSIAAITEVLFEKAGRTAPVDVLSALPKGAADLASAAPKYYAGKPHATAYIQGHLGNNPESHKVVRGQHNAVMVIINLVPGTTLNTGKLNARTDGKAMSFGLDAWYVLEEYPEDEAAVILADAVATLMNLTDGSLEVGLRLPVEASAAA